MIVVRIEMWPGGDDKKAYPLGGIIITNDGEGTDKVGHYSYSLLHAGKFFGRKGAFKQGKVYNFLRKLSPYRLVCRVLQDAKET